MTWRIKRIVARTVAASILVGLLVLLAAACFAQANPIIKTVKPAGGGDFTTLQAWEDWADDQTSGYQWAECYAGNIGMLRCEAEWATTPTAEKYPRVYVPYSQRFVGSMPVWGGTNCGSYIGYQSSSTNVFWNMYVPYLRIDGICFLDKGAQTRQMGFTGYAGAIGFRFENCLSITSNSGMYASPLGSLIMFRYCAANRHAPAIVRNNIGVGAVSGTVPTRYLGSGFKAYVGASNSFIFVNNTVVASPIPYYFDMMSTTGVLYCANNYAGEWYATTPKGFSFYNLPATSSPQPTVTFVYNVSSGSGATNGGTRFNGAGNVVGVPSTNVVVNRQNDWRLKVGSRVVDGGIRVAFSDDAWRASTWRPRGYGVDIGAQEQTNRPNVANFESLFTYPDAGEAVYFP